MPPPPQVLGQALIAQAKLDEKMNKIKRNRQKRYIIILYINMIK